MSEEEKVNQQPPKEIPSQERHPETNIEKSINYNSGWGNDLGVNRSSDNRYDKPSPLSWQPVIDQTSSNPPDGGSGSSESE